MNNLLQRIISAVFLVACAEAAQAENIMQIADTAGGENWNNASTWGEITATGNNYFTVAGISGDESASKMGDVPTTSLVRDYGTTFHGDSITLVSGSQLLLKQRNDEETNGNIILKGGVIRHATSDNAKAIISGTLEIADESWIGESSGTNNNSSSAILTISSTVKGASVLHLCAAVDPGTIAIAGDFSAFSGTLDIGNNLSDHESVTVSFDGADLSKASLKMGHNTSEDILDISGVVRFGALEFNGSPLAVGTYTVSALNAKFGNGSQFIGSGSIQIVGRP